MKQLMPFIVVIVFFILVAIFILALYNYRLKKRVLDAGPLDEMGLRFLKALASGGSESLKWGVILMSAGIGLMVLQFIPYSAEESPLPYGLEMVFIAIGFLIYYRLIRRNHEN